MTILRMSFRRLLLLSADTCFFCFTRSYRMIYLFIGGYLCYMRIPFAIVGYLCYWRIPTFQEDTCALGGYTCYRRIPMLQEDTCVIGGYLSYKMLPMCTNEDLAVVIEQILGQLVLASHIHRIVLHYKDYCQMQTCRFIFYSNDDILISIQTEIHRFKFYYKEKISAPCHIKLVPMKL